MKLRTAIALFDRQLAADGRSGHTRAAYRRDLGKLVEWLGRDPDVGRITPDRLAQFLTSDRVLHAPSGHPRKPISVNRTKSVLRSFFRFCAESGYVKENPARLIRSSRAAAKEPSTLTEAEIARLQAVLSGFDTTIARRDRVIFEILLGTGIRLGSLVALNEGYVDLKAGTLHIRAKGGTEATVFLNPRLQRLLRQHLKQNGTQGDTGGDTPLFRGRGGPRLGQRQVQLRFAHWHNKAGITRKLTVHSLRHTFATRLYRKTGDLFLVQRALGHRQITTTEIYAKVSDESFRHAVSSL